MIKAKKAAVGEADLGLKKLDHEIAAIAKEKTASVNWVASLEKMYEWIPEESS